MKQQVLNKQRIKHIIREEINDFDWAKSINNPNRMDTSRDYMGVWPKFEEMLSELDIPYIEGEIQGDDYEGRTWMRIRTLYFEFDVSIRFEYDQTIESGTVFWSIADPNENSDGSFSGEHSLVTHDWIQPVVDKLRETVKPLVEKRKRESWGHLGESSDLRVIDTSNNVSVYKDGGVADISHMGNGVWEVNRVFTKKDTRGGGLGSELLTTAINKVLQKDPTSIYVTPYGYGSNPEELYVFYGKNGFIMDDEQYGLMWYEKEHLGEY